jgi:hypothetical protein
LLRSNLRLTMYKLTLILFAFFSLVFPILAVPISVPNGIVELARCNGTTDAGDSNTDAGDSNTDTGDSTTDTGTSFAGRVRAFHSWPSHNPDFSARREPFTLLASVLVVKLILLINLSSLFLRTFSVMEAIAARCDNSLGPNMTHLDALLQNVEIHSNKTSARALVVDKCPGCGDQGIGAYSQNIATCGSIHPSDFLVRHVPHFI